MSDNAHQLDPNIRGEEPRVGGPAEDVLGSLADLESRLNGLKRLHAETAARATEQQAREQALAARELELERRSDELRARLADVERNAEETQAQQSRLSEIEQSLERQRNEISSMRERAEQDAKQLEDRDGQTLQRERELAARQESLAADEAELRSEQARLAVQESTVAKRERTLADAEAALRAQRAEIERAAKQHAELQSRAEEFERWSTAQRRELSEREVELRERVTVIEAREKELDAREMKLGELERSLDERGRALDDRDRQISSRLTEAQSLETGVAERERQLLEELERVDAIKDELVKQREALNQERARIEDDAETTRSALELRETQARNIELELENRSKQLESATDALERERAAVSEQQRTLIEQSRSEDESSAISAGRVEMLQIQIGEANARRAAAEAELIQLREEIAELKGRLAEVSQAPDRQALDREIAKRDQAIIKLREKAQQLQAALEAKGSGGQGGAAPADGRGAKALQTRRGRLALYKSLLQQQARKIVTAQNALQKRHAECEQILQQRNKLASVAQDLARREKRIAASKARSGAFTAILVLCLSTGILAVLSWQVTLRAWPGVYIAGAHVEADTHGREPNATQLDAWQRYHEELIENPQFIDTAAERLTRRGYPSLGKGAELAAKLRKDLYVQSAQDGELTLELRETGADRAQAVLDTIVTTLKSISEAGRDQRTEDFGVAIVKTAQSSERPVNEQTLMGYAGGLLGGSLLAVGLFGGLIWTRLAGSKRKFEQSQAVEEALSEVDWTTLERSMREPNFNEQAAARSKAPAKGKASRGR